MDQALALLITIAATLFVPVGVVLTEHGGTLRERWAEWRWNRAHPIKTYRFVLTAHPDAETEITIPVWFEGDFSFATWAAIDLQERLFDSATLVALTCADRPWAYIREPECWETPEFDELDQRILQLVVRAEHVDDSEYADELWALIKRLDFIRESDATVEDKRAAWEIVEEDIAALERRAEKGD